LLTEASAEQASRLFRAKGQEEFQAKRKTALFGEDVRSWAGVGRMLGASVFGVAPLRRSTANAARLPFGNPAKSEHQGKTCR
jgi:hypothetical protein